MNVREAYQTLELDYGVSLEAVKEARNLLIRVWHPDRFAHAPDLAEAAGLKTAKINDAYDVLTSALEAGQIPFEMEAVQENTPAASPAETNEAHSSPFEDVAAASSQFTQSVREGHRLGDAWWVVGILLIVGFLKFVSGDSKAPPPAVRSISKSGQRKPAFASSSPVVASYDQTLLSGQWQMPTGDVLRFSQDGTNRIRISLDHGVMLRSCKGSVSYNGDSWVGRISAVRIDDRSRSARSAPFQFTVVSSSRLSVTTDYIEWNAAGHEISRQSAVLDLQKL